MTKLPLRAALCRFLGIEARLADVRYQHKRTSMVVINMKQGGEV